METSALHVSASVANKQHITKRKLKKGHGSGVIFVIVSATLMKLVGKFMANLQIGKTAGLVIEQHV